MHSVPKIGIYTGKGTSHSWLWFVDLFETAGLHDLVFLDENDVKQGLKSLSVLVISGGDTFAVAEALGVEGAEAIQHFVDRGGLYMGSCAGAYLPMRSSKKPLDLFNFVDVKVTNLSKILPEAIRDSTKFCTAYGCDYIFHPVRESVELKSGAGALPFCPPRFSAPLYGGPGMTVPDTAFILAEYHGFTPDTQFLVSDALAETTLLGTAAIVRVPFGRGCFYLFGPHLEHPKFPVANRFVSDTIQWETRLSNHLPVGVPPGEPFLKILTGQEKKKWITHIRRELSNSRIVAVNLEFLPLRWMIGEKVYEPEKVRVFLESMWSRLSTLERMKALTVSPEDITIIRQASVHVTSGLRRLKRAVDENRDSLTEAIDTFRQLQQLSTSFFSMFFLSLTQAASEHPATDVNYLTGE